ncbi:nuclease-related domain-containing protein [Cytobacillus oceanisediminis]|uniref:nuclease-related domain-containing protein n=1 Tax=Cytobacillus oceanisediminis TaxID=665099 RepID=UPI0037362C50
MPFKPRIESAELLILKSLNNRMGLSDKDTQHYLNLKKGYEGEVQFDLWTEGLQSECFILNDLLLQLNNTVFQIDSLIIFSEALYLFEVKNYEGDYYFESDRLYKKSKSEITNPLNQLSRSVSLLRQLLQSLGSDLPLYASIVFINSEFTLYQTPLNKPFIFPTQLKRIFKDLNAIPSRLNRKHKLLADKLISRHLEESPFKLLPTYNYGQLRKGITCVECTSFLILVDGKKCICKKCGHEEMVSTAVIRSVKEFKLLFPEQKITTSVIHEWCNVVKSKKRIRKALGQNYKKIGVRQWLYYE